MPAELTLRDAAAWLHPPLTVDQIGALVALHKIEPCGVRRTGKRGRPPKTYHARELQVAHAAELRRTSKGFADNDWAATAAVALGLVVVNAGTGVITTSDRVTRAEHPTPAGYGLIYVGPLGVMAQRVVWIAWRGEIPAGMQVTHRNGRRFDNRVANLQLETARDVLRHALRRLDRHAEEPLRLARQARRQVECRAGVACPNADARTPDRPSRQSDTRPASCPRARRSATSRICA